MKKKIKEIRKLIEKSQNPIMFFDSDTDGSTSYMQFKKTYPKLKGFVFTKDLEKQKRLSNENIEKTTDLIIIIDIPFLEDEFLETIKNKQIIWIDHHPTNNKEQIKKYDIIHFNPLNYDEKDNRPACYWASQITKIKDLSYVSVGSIADHFLLDILIKFYKRDKKLFNILIGLDDNKRKEIFKFIKRDNGSEKYKDKREEYIGYLTYESRAGEFKNFFDFICKMEKFEDTLRAFKKLEKMNLSEIIQEIGAGKGFIFEDYSLMIAKYKKLYKKAEKEYNNEKFFYYEYSGKISYTKTMSEELKYKLGNNVEIVGVGFKKNKGDMMTLSFRSKNFVVNQIISDSLTDLNGRGGGHPFATGAMVKLKDLDEFKKRINKEFEDC